MGCTHLVLGEEGVAHSCEQHHPHEEGDHSLGGHFGTVAWSCTAGMRCDAERWTGVVLLYVLGLLVSSAEVVPEMVL